MRLGPWARVWPGPGARLRLGLRVRLRRWAESLVRRVLPRLVWLAPLAPTGLPVEGDSGTRRVPLSETLEVDEHGVWPRRGA